MQIVRNLIMAGVAACGIALATPAQAHDHHYYGHGHYYSSGHYWHHRWYGPGYYGPDVFVGSPFYWSGFGVTVGGPVYYPTGGYYDSYYAYPPGGYWSHGRYWYHGRYYYHGHWHH